MRPSRSPIRVPKLCQRKDGRLYCTDPHTHRPVYLHTQKEYEDWRADYLARFSIRELKATAGASNRRLSVARFGEEFLSHARIWYRKDGQPTSQVDGFRAVISRLNRLLGDRAVNSLRSADIETVLLLLVEEGLVRRTINAMLAKMKTMFRWGVRRDFVTGDTLGRILAVEPLKKGRTAAREKPRVGPVSREHVKKILPKLRPTLRAMVEIQWLTGMRPGEICGLVPADIDTVRQPWEYLPKRYKTEHRHDDEEEFRRRIFFGPRAREILDSWITTATGAEWPLFRTRRGTAMSPEGYWGHIKRACIRAGVPHFSPNQLRHATATAVRQRFGAEAARVYLGHENLKTTEVYAEKDHDLARRVAEEVG